MRQRLIYILKHNRIIQRLYVVVMSFAFRVLGFFVPTDRHLILISSFMGKSAGDSPGVLYEAIKEHPKLRGYRCVWAFEDPKKFPGYDCVTIDTPAYFLTALRAKYWITNTNIERGLKFKKKGIIYLNTWHGVALKHIGNDCPGRNDYNFDTLNYLVVSGEHDEKVFRSAFNARSESYLRCGMPRNEELWKAGDAERLVMREKLGIPEGKKVILYAPTWRESTDGGQSYAIKPPIHFDRWRERLGEEYVILFRAHHQTTKVLGVAYDSFVWDMSDYPAVNDLMIASDLLITDYSAIAFDYSILCKPILTYTYDYDTYLAERGTYFDMNEKYPNPVCMTEEDLLGRILTLDYAEERENTARFRDAFIEYGGEATKTCLRALFGKRRTDGGA